LVCQSANMQIFIFETDVSFSLSWSGKFSDLYSNM
jgi:hypothetical protein